MRMNALASTRGRVLLAVGAVVLLLLVVLVVTHGGPSNPPGEGITGRTAPAHRLTGGTLSDSCFSGFTVEPGGVVTGVQHWSLTLDVRAGIGSESAAVTTLGTSACAAQAAAVVARVNTALTLTPNTGVLFVTYLLSDGSRLILG